LPIRAEFEINIAGGNPVMVAVLSPGLLAFGERKIDAFLNPPGCVDHCVLQLGIGAR